MIQPFNYPLILSIRAVAPALALGNAVVLKPSECTPQTALELERLIATALEAEGLSAQPRPFQVVTGLGATGQALIAGGIVSSQGFVHVRVVEKKENGTHLRLVLPAAAVPIALRLVPSRRLAEAARNVWPWLPAINAAATRLADGPDVSLVEVTEPLVTASYCHCTRCQRRSGAAASPSAHPAPGASRISAGADKLRVWKPQDGGEEWDCGE